MNDVVRVERARELRGSLRVPGDKSASHRALILSALALGQSSISGLSRGLDVASTSAIVQQMGAFCEEEDGVVFVSGPAEGLRPSATPLDCGNSGTTMRLMCGVVSGVAGEHVLIGDESLSARPMDRVATPLGLMGARVRGRANEVLAPLRVTSPGRLAGIDYHVPVASAQVKGALLLAGLSATSATSIAEDIRTRTSTEDMLRQAGVAVLVHDEGEARRLTLTPGRPRRFDWHVAGDPSQAAYFAVLGAVHRDAALEVLSIDVARERVGYVSVLARMGAEVSVVDRGGFHVLRSRSSALVGTEIRASEIPSLDEVPILAVAACAASGVTSFRSMSELRVKESNRFVASMALAEALGCRVWAGGDDFFIEGLGSADLFKDFEFTSALDHRLVMAAAIAGAAGHGCTIAGASSVASSYPHFFRDLTLLQ